MAVTDSPGGFARQLNESRFPKGCRVRCKTKRGVREGQVLGYSSSPVFARVLLDGNKSDTYVEFANMLPAESSNDTTDPKVSKLVSMTGVEAYAPIEVLEEIENTLTHEDDAETITRHLDRMFETGGNARKVLDYYYQRLELKVNELNATGKLVHEVERAIANGKLHIVPGDELWVALVNAKAMTQVVDARPPAPPKVHGDVDVG